MAWGPFSDRWGRRLAFIGCLLLLSISCIGVALIPTSDYWLLLVLRCVQATGSASTVAIGPYAYVAWSIYSPLTDIAGAGVIADVATISERGSFFGLFSVGPMVRPFVMMVSLPSQL